MSSSITIGRLAALAEVNVETVRYYQRRGLLPEPCRALGQVRRYGADELSRLRFIRRAQAMGFTLAEVGQLLTLTTNQGCSATRELAAAKLNEIERRMAEMAALREELVTWIGACDANDQATCCPTLEHLGEVPHKDACSAVGLIGIEPHKPRS
jgi:MerR family mercuric resistance operon transcriptional regulator